MYNINYEDCDCWVVDNWSSSVNTDSNEFIDSTKKDYEVSEWILVTALFIQIIYMPISAIQYMKMLKKIDKRKDFL